MRKKLSLLLALVLCLGLVPSAYADNSPFEDVSTDFWAYDSIAEAYGDGVMTGTGTTKNGGLIFSPSGKLNMNQFFTVLTRAFYNEEVLNSQIAGAWPNQNFDVAQKHNLFNGIVSWRGDTEVTREVMAQMMYNVMIDKGVILPSAQELASAMARIPDFSSVDSSFQTAVAACYYLDLLSGVDANGSFSPKGQIDRAQTAVIYVRLKKTVSVSGTEVPGTTNPGTIQNPDTNPTGATLTNGMPVTEENVLALIEEYRNGKKPGEKAQAAGFTSYQEDSSYPAYDPKYRIVLPNGPINGTECAKFAFAFSDDLFGDVALRKVTDLKTVRPGDLIQFSTHWSIAVTAAYSVDWTDNPCVRTVDGGPEGVIGWGNVNMQLDGDVVAIFSRYSN